MGGWFIWLKQILDETHNFIKNMDKNYNNKKHDYRTANFELIHSCWRLLLPWFAEELILDENGDGKHNNSLDGHGAKVLSHHIPAEWVLETVFTW